MNGRFIVLEGPDGSGTTTHARLLAQSLKARGEDVLLTFEPTDGPIGAFIREQLFKKQLKAQELQILFTADRAWHVNHVLKPALDEGKTVVCERYWLSTIIYADALGIESSTLSAVNAQFIQPDLQLFLLPSLDVCLKRIGQRAERDMLEEDSLQKRVYDGYLSKAAEFGISLIDTAGDKESVAQEILAAVGS